LIGHQEILSGDYNAALEEFWKAREQSSDPDVIAAAQLGVGRVLLLQKDYSGAIEQLTWLQDNFSEGETRNYAYFFLARAYEGLGQYRSAAEAYGAYISNQPGPLDSEILEMQGDASMLAEEPDLARQAFLNAQLSATPARAELLEIKAAQAAAAAGDYEDAINRYVTLLENSTSEQVQSQVNFLLGQTYLHLGMTEQAFARFQDSVIRFPAYYDTYSGLVALVEAEQPVDYLLRGIVDYYAGQYGLTVMAMDRYMTENPNHDGTPLYYKALSLWQLGDYSGELEAWDMLINNYPRDPYLETAYIEKSSTMWRYFENYEGAAENLLQYVSIYPESPQAPQFLNTAGKYTRLAVTFRRHPERGRVYLMNIPPQNLRSLPSSIWYRPIPTATIRGCQAHLLRLLVLTSSQEDIARANFWVAKLLRTREQCRSQKLFPTKLWMQILLDITGFELIRTLKDCTRSRRRPG